MGVLHVGVRCEYVVNDLFVTGLLKHSGVKSPCLRSLLFRESGDDSPVIRVVWEEKGEGAVGGVDKLRV